MNTQKYIVAGVMSGTSLDGLDVAVCEFSLANNKWTFEILDASSNPYSPEWKTKLQELVNGSAFELAETHAKFGKFIGENVLKLIEGRQYKVQLISSHGHTVFHEPNTGFTTQIGDGAAIYAITDLPTVSDFRPLDVYKGGQGAPLVPIGDELLFSGYDFLLNLGGIANISYSENGIRKAFDVSFCNILLNYVSAKAGKEFDEGGEMASQGNVDEKLLALLDSHYYYNFPIPKSLDKTYVEKEFIPLVEKTVAGIEDLLATLCRHIAIKISAAMEHMPAGKMLITGGGAFNSHLVNEISGVCRHEVILPDEHTIMYKEAVVFAFLGLLRVLEKVNIRKSYTGASSDSMSGALYGCINLERN